MSAEHRTFVRPVVLRVIVSTTVIVPVNVVGAAVSGPSSEAGGTGRKAPVFGSRNPRMPGLDGTFDAWPQTACETMRQHMQINNSLVIFIFVSLESAVVPRFRLTQGEGDTGGGIVTTQMPSKGIRPNLVVKQKVRCLLLRFRLGPLVSGPDSRTPSLFCGRLSHRLGPKSRKRDATVSRKQTVEERNQIIAATDLDNIPMMKV